MKRNRRLYQDLAWVWPIISPPQEYIKETKNFVAIIKKHIEFKPQTLLHLGCGGGHNDFTFKKYFKVTGIDVSPAMLGLARKLNPENSYRRGDMRNVRLKQKFDVVVSPDSIAYMSSERDLKRAFETAYYHLKPGGVFLVLIESDKERFEQNKTFLSSYKKGDTEITYIENYYDPDPADTTFEANFVYLIRRRGKLAIETDRHLIGIFTVKVWLKLLQHVGFKVKVMKFYHPQLAKGYCPMLICKKEQ